jgi:hypothetical protein
MAKGFDHRSHRKLLMRQASQDLRGSVDPHLLLAAQGCDQQDQGDDLGGDDSRDQYRE